MTESAQERPSQSAARVPLAPPWRTETERAQAAAVPCGRVVVTCSAELALGGLGRHFKEVVHALERAEQPTVCLSGSTRESAARARRRTPGLPDPARLLSALPIPLSRGLRTRAMMVEFDAYAAGHLPDADHLIAFNGQALGQFREARRRRY